MSIDSRLKERRRTVAEDNAKKNMGRILKFLLLVVVIGAGVWLFFSPWLSVKRVTTEGILQSDSHMVLVDERVAAGTPMILIRSSRVEAALLEDPWVAAATVSLDWPGDVMVAVTERTPAAWVRTEGGWTRRAIDGVALPSAPEPGEGMARIEMPAISDSETSGAGDLLGALEFVTALPPNLQRGTVVTRQDGEIWATVSGYQTRLGRAVEMSEKARSLTALLSEDIPEGSTLNVIAPTHPTFKAPGQGDESNDETASEAENSDEDSSSEADQAVTGDP